MLGMEGEVHEEKALHSMPLDRYPSSSLFSNIILNFNHQQY